MKICLLGDSESATLDEGMRNVAFNLRKHLETRHEVILLDVRKGLFGRLWREVRCFKPSIIHYVAGPSLLSLILLRLAEATTPGSRTFLSALHPWFPGPTKDLIGALRPDCVLVQSKSAESLFRRAGCTTAFLSNGVDIERFCPLMPDEKRRLRAKLGIPEDKFVILHVGPLKRKRGLTELLSLQGPDRMVVVLASTSAGVDAGMRAELEGGGCRLLMGYMPDVEKLYASADVYVFPVRDPLSAIEGPLSILEAMACNLSVATYPFGGIPDLFEEGDGLFFVRSPHEILDRIERVRAGMRIRTRDKVLPYRWEDIGLRLEKFYEHA